MTETFFISDTHFGHSRIISLANRPYLDVEEMDAALIQNWNSVVSDHDSVYFLGDFSFYKDRTKNEEIFNSLKGKKHLIFGNHDWNGTRDLSWISQNQYLELRVPETVVLFHYPIESWNKAFHGSLMIHGHVHSSPENRKVRMVKNRFEVCVENIGYYPRTLDEIKKFMKEDQEIFENTSNDV